MSVETSMNAPPEARTASPTIRPASLIRPRTRYRSAPAATHSLRVISGASSGMAIRLRSPARAA